MLMPTDRSAARRVLDAWFERHGITPSIVAEFDDSALVKTFGQAGTGVFAAPAAIEDEVQNQLGVASIGRTRDVIARFYALSMEKRIKHPAVVAITERARADVFNLAAATRRAGRAPA